MSINLRVREGDRVRCHVCEQQMQPRVKGFYTIPAHDAQCGSPCTGGDASKGHPYSCDCTAASSTGANYEPRIAYGGWVTANGFVVGGNHRASHADDLTFTREVRS